MIDLAAIAKDASERVHKNGGCVPQLAYAPILFALQDAMAATPSPVKPLDWRKPTRRDRDEGGRDTAIWIAPGHGGEYAIQPDLTNFILWRIDDPYAFDTFPTVEAAKAHAEADWQRTIGRKLAPLSPGIQGAA